MTRERRYRAYVLCSSQLDQLIQHAFGSEEPPRCWIKDHYDIPDDASFLYRAYWCPDRDGFLMTFEHDSFDPVPDGQAIPVFYPSHSTQHNEPDHDHPHAPSNEREKRLESYLHALLGMVDTSYLSSRQSALLDKVQKELDGEA